MKGENLFDALGKIDERLIDVAKPGKVHIYQKNIFKAVGIAACICLLVTGYSVSAVIRARDGNLPMLDKNAVIFEPMGMGYEGTDDLTLKNSDNINPWTKDVVLKTLPVYKNLRYNEGKLSQTYYSAEDLKKQTEKFAEFMGLDIIGGEEIAGETENEIYNYILQTKQGQVSTNGMGISFNIKKGYEHLLSRHTDFCYASETEKVSGVYRKYSVDGELLDEEKRSYYKYGDIIDNIVNFNLQSHWQSDGETYTNSRNDDYMSSSEKLGDYHVITWQQAQKKLLEGNYVTSADESQIEGGNLTENAVADVDLIYYTTGNQQLYMPYYRFYVKYYSADSDNQRYAYFYVCAVKEEYFKGYEKFDGSFQ